VPPPQPAVGDPPTDDGQREYKEVGNRPAIPVGGPGVPPLVAAAGVGYGEGFAGNTHNFAPTGMMAADMANGPVQRIQPWPEALCGGR